MSFALPVERLRETETLLAFRHPRPSHAVHILIVPKEPFESLLDVPPEAGGFLRNLLETVQVLVREHGLEDRGYRLIVNGGEYQDVPLLHVHLVADEDPRGSARVPCTSQAPSGVRGTWMLWKARTGGQAEEDV